MYFNRYSSYAGSLGCLLYIAIQTSKEGSRCALVSVIASRAFQFSLAKYTRIHNIQVILFQQQYNTKHFFAIIAYNNTSDMIQKLMINMYSETVWIFQSSIIATFQWDATL